MRRLLLSEGGISGKGAGQLRAFVDGIDRWHAATGRAGASHIELAETILEESGYTAMWQNDKTPEAPGRLENLKELVKALEQFENLQGFLEHVALIMDNDTGEADDKVSIMTLHAAKGLEFPAVFLPGWEDGLFPSPALDGRKRAEGARGGASPRLCRHHPGRAAVHHLLRREPPGLRPVAVGSCRRASSTNCPRSMSRC